MAGSVSPNELVDMAFQANLWETVNGATSRIRVDMSTVTVLRLMVDPEDAIKLVV